MAQIIEQSDKFGKIGKAFGQGMGDQIPKEVDRYRLSQGLKNFEQESGNLTPIQQLTRLYSIPGITPQMIQSFGDLAKQQNMRNAYTQPGGVNRGSIATGGTQGTMPQQQLNNIIQGQIQPQQTPAQQRAENVSPETVGQPQVVNTNPLRQEAMPVAPWTPERRNQEMANVLNDFPAMNTQEAQQVVADNEARALAQPKAQQDKDIYLKGVQAEAKDKFTNLLETKLQKTGQGVYEDITGGMLNNLHRGMERELRTNPNATPDDVANKWTEKALDLAKTKTQFEKLAGKTGFENILDKDKTLHKLKGFQDIYDKAGNKEEYFNALKEKMALSPQGAASIAFPRNKNINAYTSKIKASNINDVRNRDSLARQHAAKIENLITSDDSLLAIARDLREKDPYFNQTAFFEQLLEDADQIGLNARQKREIAEGASDILPSWGDIFVLPFFRGL